MIGWITEPTTVLLASRLERTHRPDLTFLSPCFSHSVMDSYLNRTNIGTGTVPMDATLSSTQIDPHRDVDVAASAAKDRWTGVEDALSRLAHRAARDIADPRTRTDESDVSAGHQAAAPANASQVSAGPQADGPSALATLRPAEFRNDPLRREEPSTIGRVARAATRFLVALGVGVGGTFAWQSYGDAAKGMIANLAPQLAWISSRLATNPARDPAPTSAPTAPGPAIEASTPQPAAAQAASVAQAATDMPAAAAAQAAPPVAPTATEQAATNTTARTVPAPPSPDQQQLDTMARDIGDLRQSVEQLAARQEQMARDMASLKATEASRHRIAAPPRPAAARKPPPQAAPQAIPALSSALSSPQPLPPPPPIASAPPMPAVSPPPAAPPQPAAEPQPLRPPMPVPGQ